MSTSENLMYALHIIQGQGHKIRLFAIIKGSTSR